MYFNITTLFGLQANIEYDDFLKQVDPDENTKDKLMNNVIKEFVDFISKRASSILIDFVIINYELSMYNTVVIEIFQTNSGYQSRIFVNSLKFDLYSTTEHFVRLTFEIFFVLITLYYLVRSLSNDIYTTKKLYNLKKKKIFKRFYTENLTLENQSEKIKDNCYISNIKETNSNSTIDLTALDVVYILEVIEFEIISFPNICNSAKFNVVSPETDNNLLLLSVSNF